MVRLMRSKIIIVLAFVVLGLVALQIPINTLAASKVKFTLFDLFAPITGAFLGAGLGIFSVLTIQIVNLISHGFSAVNTASPLTFIATLRFLPLIIGVYFFAKKEGRLLVIPALAILIFNLHPVGRTVWFYSLFWIIPFVLWPFRDRFLLARALSATFAAHAVGGAVWIWAFNLPANVWISLIPVVILERSIFALGISASYILTNNILGYLTARKLIPKAITFDRKYYFLPKA